MNTLNKAVLQAATLAGLMGVAAGCATFGGNSASAPSKTVTIVTSEDQRLTAPAPKVPKATVKQLEAKRRTGDVGAATDLARLYLAAGQLEQAAKAATTAVQMDFRQRAPKIVMAEVALRRHDLDSAKAILSSIGGESSGDADVLNCLAIIAAMEEQIGSARHYAELALQRDPTNVAARMNLGILELNAGAGAAAANEFQKVVSKRPDDAVALLHLAVAEASLGRFDRAEDHYDRAKSIVKTKGLLVLDEAILKKRMKNYDDAIAELKDYLAAAGKNADIDSVMRTIADIRAQQTNLAPVTKSDIDELSDQLEESGGKKLNDGGDLRIVSSVGSFEGD